MGRNSDFLKRGFYLSAFLPFLFFTLILASKAAAQNHPWTSDSYQKNILNQPIYNDISFQGIKADKTNFSAIAGKDDKKPFKASMLKQGPYIGIQRGKYTVLEMGYQILKKDIKLKKPLRLAVNGGFHYNFKRNVVGYDLGSWVRFGRVGLTYGLNLNLRSNFDHTKVGISPALGYRLLNFHIQTGYHFLSHPNIEMETNTLFISLKYCFTTGRKLKIDRE